MSRGQLSAEPADNLVGAVSKPWIPPAHPGPCPGHSGCLEQAGWRREQRGREEGLAWEPRWSAETGQPGKALFSGFDTKIHPLLGLAVTGTG